MKTKQKEGMNVSTIRSADMRQFDADLAKLYGLDEAVFICYLHKQLWEVFMLKVNRQRAGEKLELVILGGQPWIPKTHKDFCADLPFWTERQICRVIESCKRKGLLDVSSYEPNPMNRRLWYSLKGVTTDDWCQG